MSYIHAAIAINALILAGWLFGAAGGYYYARYCVQPAPLVKRAREGPHANSGDAR